MKRELYIGDNLDILRRYIPSESADVVYLDPPFKSDRQYNALFIRRAGARAVAQERAFEDTWEWNPAAEHACHLMTRAPGKLGEAIAALYRLLGEVPMMAYIAMMAPRLVELRRAMKPSGSLYLHCDPTASHYLKILLDAIFGPENFRNEIVWKRTSAHSSAKRYGPVHDILLYYARSAKHVRWIGAHQLYDEAYIKQRFRMTEERPWKDADLTGSGTREGDTGLPWRGFNPTEKGRHWAYPPDELERLNDAGLIYWPKKVGGWPRLKKFIDQAKGIPLQDVWTDITPVNSQALERVGFPTQKPNALLRRIIEASTRPGDMILDPFCGCGTAVVVAEHLKRQWIGIDITDVALEVIGMRLQREIGPVPYVVKAIEPRALPEAVALARKDRKAFETWALGLVGARPDTPHRGADRGIDARFLDSHGRPVIVSVKSGKVTVPQLRDLRGVLDREGAIVGAFITLYQPTKAMIREAASAGAYEAPTGLVPRIQILTIAQLLDANSRRLTYPPPDASLRRTLPERGRGPEQFRLPLVTAVPGGQHSRLPRQEVPTAAPPHYASRSRQGLRASLRPLGANQLAIDHVDQAVPWHLARQALSKAPSRRRQTGNRKRRRAS